MKLNQFDTDKVVATFMELRKPLFVLTILWGSSIAMLLSSGTAQAALRCDCSQIVDNCSATVSLDGMKVGIESDNEACSRVDYLIDGQPFAALVVGGSTEVTWPGQPLRDASIVVENCRVCAEASADAAPADETGSDSEEAAAQEEGGSDDTQAIIKIMPQYPRDAWTNNIEGDVVVKYDVSDTGEVQNVKVVKSSNALLSAATVEAVSRFRFQLANSDGKVAAQTGLQERFSFRILGGTDPVVTSASQ